MEGTEVSLADEVEGGVEVAPAEEVVSLLPGMGVLSLSPGEGRL
jgi:hypothetical protein